MSNQGAAASASRQNYVGDERCRQCHAEKVESYLKTAHHLTSRMPSTDSILGSFEKGQNTLKTSNANLQFRMESKTDGFYQTSVWATPQTISTRSQRMDLAVGSGRVGQTYLYWKADQLFQLPVSYWTELATWVNSPGYRDGTVNFDRPVPPRCLDCHATYAEVKGSQLSSNRYIPDSLVVGISCERCHGPARKHVEAMTAKSSVGNMMKLSKLNRERQIEVCAQCHGGKRIPLKDCFSYTPGEPLDTYYVRDTSNAPAVADVHGNQVALLQMSRCYQSSSDLSCFTCHDVHQTQRAPASFSDHCLKCHRPENCGEFAKLQEKIKGDCVHCHMPVQVSQLIKSNMIGKQARPTMRTHWIKVYAEPQMP